MANFLNLIYLAVTLVPIALELFIDTSSKMAKQMEPPVAHREAKKTCNRECSTCPFLKEIRKANVATK